MKILYKEYLDYYDVPLTIVCFSDNNNQRFVGELIDDDPSLKYLFSEVTDQQYNEYIKGIVDLRYLFLNKPLNIGTVNHFDEPFEITEVTPEVFNPNWLPGSGYFCSSK